MDNLIITQEFRFQKGGSRFYTQVGEKLKVRTDHVIEGILTSVDPDGEYFRMNCGDESVKIYCENVLDIMPV